MTETIDYIEAITEMLTRFPITRDNDVILLAYLLWGPPHRLDLKTITAHELLRRMAEGELPHFETVRRTRQRIQQENPALRGTRTRERQEIQRRVRAQIAQRNLAHDMDSSLNNTQEGAR